MNLMASTIDPTLDLVAEIKRLREEKNAVILAHYYQAGEIRSTKNLSGMPSAPTKA